MKILNYKRNNNISNTYYYIKKTEVGLDVDASRSNMEWGRNGAKTNMGLGADASRSNVDDSRPNLALDVDTSRANMTVGGDASRPNMVLGGAVSILRWGGAWMRSNPTW